MTVKLHISPCPNDTFMFDAMLHGRVDCEGLTFEPEFADIEELNRGAIRGIPTVSKVSCAVLPEITARYALLDSGSALGRGNGPLLVGCSTDQALAGAGQRVAVPGLHTTANLLIKRYYPDCERVPVLFSEIAEAVLDGSFSAGVLIHEGRFTYMDKGLELICDLGKQWEQETSMPLPLGSIVCSREMDDDLRCRIERTLTRSVRYGFENRGASRAFVRQHARELSQEVIDSHIDLFVNEFSVSLAGQGRRAISLLTGISEGEL